MSQPSMIFHVAYPLSSDPKNASALRPVRMRRAFEEIGYRVYEVSGTHAERRDKIKTLKRLIREGLRPDFVYSEAATTPTGLGQPVTAATSLTRDIAFLRFCERRGIRVGLFYRDIYWCFPIYTETVPRPIAFVLRRFYRWDLRRYRRGRFRIYLPSVRMADWMPIIDRRRVRALPPGGESRPFRAPTRGEDLRLLYVGGLGSNYRLHQTVREIAAVDGVSLTICIPEAHWADRESEYVGLLAENIRIVHRSGAGLPDLYAEADMCLLAVEPIDYWSFAAPVKLFEYISYGRPIVASNGTFSGRFVEDAGIGWSIDYGSGELVALLRRLRADRTELEARADRVRAVQQEHTWQARAREVARDLASAE